MPDLTASQLAAEIAKAMDDLLAVRRRVEEMHDQYVPKGAPARWALDAAIGGITCVRSALADAAEEVRRG